MDREDFKYIWLLLKEITGREKKMAACTLLLSVLEAVNPYIAILCTGLLVDGAYRGEGLRALFSCAAAALALKLLVQIFCSRLGEWFNQKMDYTRELDEEQLNRQSLFMDYEYLEDTSIQELRTRLLGRSFLMVPVTAQGFPKGAAFRPYGDCNFVPYGPAGGAGRGKREPFPAGFPAFVPCNRGFSMGELPGGHPLHQKVCGDTGWAGRRPQQKRLLPGYAIRCGIPEGFKDQRAAGGNQSGCGRFV